MHGQKNHFGLATQAAELLDRVEAVQQGHRDVGDNHIRLQPLRSRDQFSAVLHDFDQFISGLQEAAQPLGHQAVVIGQQDSGTRHGSLSTLCRTDCQIRPAFSMSCCPCGRIGNPSYGSWGNGTRTWMVVPWPGLEEIKISPPTRRTRSSMLASPRPDRRSPATGSKPRPKSRTSRSRNSRSVFNVTSTRSTWACLTALRKASWAIRYTHRARSLGTLAGNLPQRKSTAKRSRSATRSHSARRASLSPRSSKIAGCSCRDRRCTSSDKAIRCCLRPASAARAGPRAGKSCSTFPASMAPAASRCEMSSCNSRAIRLRSSS